MLEAQSLECVRGERVLFRELSLQLAPGALLHVRGVNGSGKSSLLRILCGLLKPTEGEVRWRGEPIARLGEDFHRELLYVGHRNGIKEDLTVAENLRVWAGMAGRSIDDAAIDAALAEVGLADYGDVLARHLSQGQGRRVALARLYLTGGARLWILDEPFAALDKRATESLSHCIAQRLASDGMVILTTHQDVPISAKTEATLKLGADGSASVPC